MKKKYKDKTIRKRVEETDPMKNLNMQTKKRDKENKKERQKDFEMLTTLLYEDDQRIEIVRHVRSAFKNADTLSLSLSLTHTRSLSHTRTHTHTLSRTHAHTNTHTHSLSYTHIISLSL
jgi:hypothetical protein